MPLPLEIAASATPSRTSRASNAASAPDRDGGQSEAFSNALANALNRPVAGSKTETGKAAARQVQAGESASKSATGKPEQAPKAENEPEASTASIAQENTANPITVPQATEQSQTEPIIQEQPDEAAALASESETSTDINAPDITPAPQNALPDSKQASALKDSRPRGLEIANARHELQSNFGREVSAHAFEASAPAEIAQNAPGHQKLEATKPAEKENPKPTEEQPAQKSAQLEAQMASTPPSVISMLLPGQLAQSLPVQSAPYRASVEQSLTTPTTDQIQAAPIPLQGLSTVDKAAMAVAGFNLPPHTGIGKASAEALPEATKQAGPFGNDNLPQANFDMAAPPSANLGANRDMLLPKGDQGSAKPLPDVIAQGIGNAAQSIPPELTPGPKDFSRLETIQEHLHAMNGEVTPSGKVNPSSNQTANNAPAQAAASFGPTAQKPTGQRVETPSSLLQDAKDDNLGEAAQSTEDAAPDSFSVPLGNAVIDGANASGTAPTGDAPKFVSSAKEPMAQVLDGTSYAAKNGHKELTIRLNPDNLGEVRVNFVSRGANELTARLIATTPESHRLLESQVDTLRSSLEAQGVRVAHVAVVLAGAGSSDMNSAGNGTSQNFQQHNGQQQSSGQSASGFNQQQADQQSQANAFAQQMAQSGQHHAKSPYAPPPGNASRRDAHEADPTASIGGIDANTRPTVNEEGNISILV